MTLSRFALAAALFCLASCEREAARVLDARRAAVSAKLDRVQALLPTLAAVPPVTEPSLTLGPTPLIFAGATSSPLPTATVVYEQALPDLRVLNEAGPHYRVRIGQAQLLEDCGELLRRGADDAIPAVTKTRLDSCLNIEYVFVLRTRTFKDHDFQGDVVAFSLATGRAIGGFPIDFTSASRTDTVTTSSYTTTRTRRGRVPTVTKNTTTRTVNTDSQQIRFDLADAIEAEIKELAPSVQWPK